MVAQNTRCVVAGAQMLKPVAYLREFRCKSDVGNIPGDRDVVGSLRLQIGDDSGKRFRIMNEAPFLLPIDIARHALADQLAPAGHRKGGEMGIGKMREGKHCVCHVRPCAGHPRLGSIAGSSKTWTGGTSPAMTDWRHYELPI